VYVDGFRLTPQKGEFFEGAKVLEFFVRHIAVEKKLGRPKIMRCGAIGQVP
jgi:hypothetical protein